MSDEAPFRRFRANVILRGGLAKPWFQDGQVSAGLSCGSAETKSLPSGAPANELGLEIPNPGRADFLIRGV
jgi:hypothetical protein